MWIAILGGVAVGLLIAMFLVIRQERRYRLLFSDTHLVELARCLEASRVGSSKATYEGIEVAWERLPAHVAVTLRARHAVAPAASRFFLAFVAEVVGGAPIAYLQTDRRGLAVVWARAAIDLERALPTPDDAALTAVRSRAADRMKQLPLTDGSLAAYR